MLSAIAIVQLRICTKSKIYLNKYTYWRQDSLNQGSYVCVDFVFVTQISKLKQLEADNRLLNILLEFGNKQSINSGHSVKVHSTSYWSL